MVQTYDDFSSLSYSLAYVICPTRICHADLDDPSVMNEALRWFPPVVNVPKTSAEDTTFTTTNAAGEKITIPVPRGSRISITTPCLHNNRKLHSLLRAVLDAVLVLRSSTLIIYLASAILGRSQLVQARSVPRQLPARRVPTVQRRSARMHRTRVRGDRGCRGAHHDHLAVQSRGER